MKMAFNSKVSKELNTELILKCIRANDEISKVDISKLTGISLPSVSTIVDELLLKQLVVKIGTGESTGGRKPVLYSYNKNYGYFVIASLENNLLKLRLINLYGEIILNDNIDIKYDNYEELTFLIISGLTRMVNIKGIFFDKILSIYIIAEGYQDYNSDKFIFNRYKSLNEINISNFIKSKLSDIPVKILSNINMMALGEWYKSNNKKYKRLVLINIDRNINDDICFSIVNDGNLINPSKGYLGKIRKSIIFPDIKAIKSHGYEEIGKLIREFNSNKQRALNPFLDLFNFITELVSDIQYFIDPDIIIFTGYIEHQAFIDMVKMRIKNEGITTNIQKSSLGDEMEIYGCIEIALSDFFENNNDLKIRNADF